MERKMGKGRAILRRSCGIAQRSASHSRERAERATNHARAQTGRKFAFSRSAGHDCRRDTARARARARYVPTHARRCGWKLPRSGTDQRALRRPPSRSLHTRTGKKEKYSVPISCFPPPLSLFPLFSTSGCRDLPITEIMESRGGNVGDLNCLEGVFFTTAYQLRSHDDAHNQ